MADRSVLYICHNHPEVRPGGGEEYALELHHAMGTAGTYRSTFLARAGPPLSSMRNPHVGTIFSRVNADPRQYFVHADDYTYDWVFGTYRDKEIYTKHFRDFLLAHRPDVVHFQHTQHIGLDLVRLVRNTLPDAAIVYTLHEYLTICHRQGQMLRTNGERCLEASPRRCNECFPEISPQTFFLRKRFATAQLAAVDRFIAPSRFLAERYIDWGIPRERIWCEEYGRQFLPSIVEDSGEHPGHRLGFFGQVNPYKGVTVLLEAMRLLAEDEPPDGRARRPHLWIHGANLDMQEGGFQKEVARLLADAGNVTWMGQYQHAELPALMRDLDWVVVPSTWWENSPLVIQEAFHHRRPVICSDVGGMAEKVTDGVDGLHFTAGDAGSLAAVLRRATTTAGLWERLRNGIGAVHTMDAHVPALCALYDELLDGGRPPAAADRAAL